MTMSANCKLSYINNDKKDPAIAAECVPQNRKNRLQNTVIIEGEYVYGPIITVRFIDGDRCHVYM
jgi:hypothetical protein